MIIRRLKEMKGGWFIGNFKPAILQTSQFEVAVKRHKKGEHWPEHYQKVAVEINVMVSGQLKIGNDIFTKGDIFAVRALEKVKPKFLTDVVVVVVKVPSLPGDKVEC